MNGGRHSWQRMTLVERVRWLRLLLPPLLAAWVVTYQLGIAKAVEITYGHVVHYGVEIAFYSLAGPVVTLLTLAWVERNLREKEALERQIQAAQREKTAVLEEERARIARDLHDGVAQTLYFLALKADSLRSRLETDAHAVAELREMGQAARRVIRDVRRTIFALRPLDWPASGFLPALQQFIDGFAEQARWQAQTAIQPGLVLPPELEPTVFRLTQESLNNVAKHAEATRVWVELTAAKDGAWLLLSVRDDGHGYAPQQADNHGLGVAQMRSRVEAAGGSFEIRAQADGGTAVVARLPLKEQNHA